MKRRHSPARILPVFVILALAGIFLPLEATAGGNRAVVSYRNGNWSFQARLGGYNRGWGVRCAPTFIPGRVCRVPWYPRVICAYPRVGYGYAHGYYYDGPDSFRPGPDPAEYYGLRMDGRPVSAPLPPVPAGAASEGAEPGEEVEVRPLDPRIVIPASLPYLAELPAVRADDAVTAVR